MIKAPKCLGADTGVLAGWITEGGSGERFFCPVIRLVRAIVFGACHLRFTPWLDRVRMALRQSAVASPCPRQNRARIT